MGQGRPGVAKPDLSSRNDGQTGDADALPVSVLAPLAPRPENDQGRKGGISGVGKGSRLWGEAEYVTGRWRGNCGWDEGTKSAHAK